MNKRLERYVRHAQRFGDARTVFETAWQDDFTAAELVHLAGRLRRFKPREYIAGRAGNRVIYKKWPRFALKKRAKVVGLSDPRAWPRERARAPEARRPCRDPADSCHTAATSGRGGRMTSDVHPNLYRSPIVGT